MKNKYVFATAAFVAVFLFLGSQVIAQPTLGTYSNTTIRAGGNTTLSPTAAPTGAVRAAAVSSPGFTGSFVVSPTTGIVRITNAGPTGTYTVTVRVFNVAGQFAARLFTLTVTGSFPGGHIAFRTSYFLTGARDKKTVIAVGDINNDGNQDLVTAGGVTAGGIAIMLGQGDGSFGSPTFQNGGFPIGVAIADFNGDGRQDVVTINENPAGASTWLGNGNGTFAAPVNVAVGTTPFGVATGDFNNDGNHDFATANAQGGTVSIRLGNGTGGFAALTSITTGAEHHHIAVSDFNNDNIQDLAVLMNFGFGGRAIGIFVGNGSGGFTFTNNFETGGFSFAVAKLNSDANQDLVGAGTSTNIASMLGTGTANFGSPIGSNAFTGGLSFGTADFNGDGRQDLAVGGNNSLGLQIGNGNGTFTQGHVFEIGALSHTTVIADFNADGRPDVALQQNLPNCPTCNNTTTTVAIRRAIAQSVDFDGDSVTDVSVFRPSDGVWYIKNSSTGSVTYQPWGLSTDRPVPADYDGDARTDIAIWRPGALAYFYILNSSTGTLRLEQFGQTGDEPIAGDFSVPTTLGTFPDGKADPAVYRNGTAGGESTFFFRDSSNNPNNNVTYFPWGSDGDRPVVGDYDGDGTSEIAVFRPSNRIWYLRSLGQGTISYLQFGLSDDKLVPLDYDGDGKTDMAVFRSSTGTWYVNQSMTNQLRITQWGTPTDRPVPGDYDGDGNVDLAVFRDGTWYILRSTSGSLNVEFFGVNGDVPGPAAFLQ